MSTLIRHHVKAVHFQLQKTLTGQSACGDSSGKRQLLLLVAEDEADEEEDEEDDLLSARG